MRKFYVSNDCSTIRDVLFSVLELDARYKLWVTPSNRHHSLFSVSHFCVYSVLRNNLNITGHRWTFSISNYWYIIRNIISVVYSCTRDPTGELRPETRIGRSLIQHCVRILQAHLYIIIWYATMTDNETHVPYDCLLHTKRRLYNQRCIICIKQSWLATLHIVVL